MIALLTLVVSGFYLCRVGYAVEVAATAFVFALSAVIVKGFENVQQDSKHSH